MENLNEFIREKNISPSHVYNNIHLIETQKTIKTQLENLAGIYMILNRSTKDYYIGSASTNRFFSRFSNHLIHFTGSKLLKNAVKKYGLNNFSFLILEIYPEKVNIENNKKLLDIEDFYLKSLLPNYNILTEAGSSFGYKHTEITRIKMKAIYSQKRRDFIGNLNRNLNLSLTIKEKLRLKALNRKVIYSKESLYRMKKNSKPLIIYNLNGTVYGEFSSITDAALNLSCSVKTIHRALRTEKKLLKRRYRVYLKNV